MNKITFITILAFATLLFSIFSGESKNSLSQITLDNDSTILAFGDSITYGYGVSNASSYPSQLHKITGLHVVNAGVNGEESFEGLKRLPEFLKNKPDLVILCHGGNDIMRQHSQVKLKNNLLKMISLIQSSGAKVLLVGVPGFGLFGFDTLELYSEIAKETGVMYEKDILSYVESDNALKVDTIHPNEKGYAIMADAFAKRINKL